MPTYYTPKNTSTHDWYSLLSVIDAILHTPKYSSCRITPVSQCWIIPHSTISEPWSPESASNWPTPLYHHLGISPPIKCMTIPFARRSLRPQPCKVKCASEQIKDFFNDEPQCSEPSTLYLLLANALALRKIFIHLSQVPCMVKHRIGKSAGQIR